MRDRSRRPDAPRLGCFLALSLAACRGTAATNTSDPPTTTVTAKERHDPSTRERALAMAQYVQGDAPLYPEISRRLGEEGTVELRFEVDERGDVRSLEISRSSGSQRLDRAALEAARSWRFHPRTGSPSVEVLVHRVVFQLIGG